MAEQVQEQVEARVFVDPFQICRSIPAGTGQDLSDAHIMRVKDMRVDAETLQAYPVYEVVDLQQEIDARVDDCGMVMMKRLIATGQAKPSDFADDGQHGVDFSEIPADVHEMAKKADEVNATVTNLLAALGVQEGDVLTQQMVEKLLTDKVAELYKKQQESANNVVVEETTK